MQAPQPAGARRSLEEIEPVRLDDLLDVDLGVAGLDDLGIRIQQFDQLPDPLPDRLVDRLDLVDDQDVCKLDLIDHQVGDGPLVVRRDLLRAVAVGQEFGGVEVGEEVEGINDGDGRVQSG